MRKFLLFLAMCMYPLFAMADGEYYTDEAQQIVNSSQDIANSLRQDYAELEKQILKLDPKYVDLLNNRELFTDEEKLTMARSYLAQKAFDYYKDTFMSELEQRSKETGRKITQEYFGVDTKYNFTGQRLWLDRGKLDSTECMRDGWIICKYPDKFEDFEIELTDYSQKDEYESKALSGNNNYTKMINYDKDIPDKNARQYCRIALQYNSKSQVSDAGHLSGEDLSLDVDCSVEKYDEFYAWQNQEVEDTINGKHDVIGKEVLPDGRIYIIERQSEDFSKWKSNYIPASYMIGRGYDYSNSITTTHKDTK